MSVVRRTIPAHLVRALEFHADLPILEDRAGTVTLRELTDLAARAATGLRKAGVGKGTHVGFYADNSRRWILTDLAIQLAGGVSVPRGTDTPIGEMAELFRHAEVELAFVQARRHAEALEGVRQQVPSLREILCMDGEGAPGRTLDDLIAAGDGGPTFGQLADEVEPDDLATIIYTSGTTGRPKGVMLTQANFGHQAAVGPGLFNIGAIGESFLSVLPPWHVFERTVEYVALAAGARLQYTDRRRFKEDLSRFEPTFVPSVPRIWETVYAGVQKALQSGSPLRRAIFKAGYGVAAVRTRCWDRARGHVFRIRRPRGLGRAADAVVRGGALLGAALAWLPDRLAAAVVFKRMRKLTGGRLRGAISGGGHMPDHIDRFLRTIELPILVGYGLTETSPICCVRRMDRNVLGTIGVAIPEVELAIRDPETGIFLPHGGVGEICTRGPHVMRGYYKDEELTRSVIDADGWFATGDLGFLTEEGDLCFRGRLKETIVLKGGENIEPAAVEDAILTSPLIEQAIVVGQDQKVLAALLVPDRETLAQRLDVAPDAPLAELAARADVRDLLRKDCAASTSGLKPQERVARVAVLPEAPGVENGLLTQTLKLRRHLVVERFADQIEEAYQR